MISNVYIRLLIPRRVDGVLFVEVDLPPPAGWEILFSLGWVDLGDRSIPDETPPHAAARRFPSPRAERGFKFSMGWVDLGIVVFPTRPHPSGLRRFFPMGR